MRDMLTLLSIYLQVKASVNVTNLLVAHMPWSNNRSIYAGSDPGSLAHAIKHLVERAGGLKNLKIQAMPKTIAKYGSDLCHSCIYVRY